MNYPTVDQLHTWANTLARTDWHDITHRLAIAINRERRGGNSQPDGYPTSTRGGQGGGELTSVEAAASARIHGVRDEHHDLTVNAIGWLQDALLASQACANTLAKMEAHSIPATFEDDRWCRSCKRDAGYLEPVNAPRYAYYCRFCGDWAGEHRADPPLDILRARHDGRRITTDMVDKALRRARLAGRA